MRMTLCALVISLVLLPAAALAQDAEEKPSLDGKAIAWIQLLQREQFDSAAAQASPSVAAQMTPEVLTNAWTQMGAQLGNMTALEAGTSAEEGGYQIVDLKGTFDAGPFTVRVVFDAEGLVAGFFIQPPGEDRRPR